MTLLLPRIKFCYLITLLIILSAGCKTIPKESNNPGRDPLLENKRWVLRELNGVEVKAAKEQVLSFEPGNNMINGNGGCNTMNGMYTVHDDLIKIQAMATTERACTDTTDQQREAEFWKVLAQTDRYKLRRKMSKGVNLELLELLKEKEIIARFEAVYLN